MKKNKMKSKHWILSAVLLCSTFAQAQPKATYHVEIRSEQILKSGERITISHPTDETGSPDDYQRISWWANLPWNGNDAPYSLARQQIDKAVAQGVSPRKLMEKYQSQLRSDQWNPLKIFRWGYAANVTRLKQTKTRVEGEKLLKPVSDTIAQAKFPGSYQYARLGFIALAFNQPRIYLKYLGDRLLQRNPQDEAVKFWTARCLILKGGTPDDQRGFRYLKWFQKKYPNDPSYYREEADAYRLIYSWETEDENRKQQKAELAKHAFRVYLAKVKDPDRRKYALWEIKDIDRTFAFWKVQRSRLKAMGRS